MNWLQSWRESKFFHVLSFFTFPAAVFVVNLILNNILGLYNVFPFNCVILHFIGGISIGYMFVLFLRFFEEENLIRIRNRFIFILFVVSFVCFVAVLWEFYEYIMVYFFGLNWFMNYKDTLLDLLVGSFGGLIVGVFGSLKLKK